MLHLGNARAVAAAMHRSFFVIMYLSTFLQAAPVIFEFTASLVNKIEADKGVCSRA